MSRHAGFGATGRNHAHTSVLKHTMKRVVASLFAAGSLLLSDSCATHPEPAVTKWEYQVVTDSVQANQMAAKGWVVAGFSRYTDATGKPHVNYMMKRPKQ